jgi:hypothetical protein
MRRLSSKFAMSTGRAPTFRIYEYAGLCLAAGQIDRPRGVSRRENSQRALSFSTEASNSIRPDPRGSLKTEVDLPVWAVSLRTSTSELNRNFGFSWAKLTLSSRKFPQLFSDLRVEQGIRNETVAEDLDGLTERARLDKPCSGSFRTHCIRPKSWR